MRSVSLVLALFGLLVSGVASSASAQGHRQRPAGKKWVYPLYERVDPVVPPEALYSGDGFADLAVSVIMFEEGDRKGSRALVELGGERKMRKVVKEGDLVNDYVVHRIERDRIVVRIKTLGAFRDEEVLLRGMKTVEWP